MDALELPRDAGAVSTDSCGVVAENHRFRPRWHTLRKCPSTARFQNRNRPGLLARCANQREGCGWETTPASRSSVSRHYRFRSARCAGRRGWAGASRVREVGSGLSQREQREQLVYAAWRRAIDVVLVWQLDRWDRSVADLVSTLQELTEVGVDFVSLTEALDFTTPVGRAMAGLPAVFAAFERDSVRVRAGLDHARSLGKRLGRTLLSAAVAGDARRLARTGISKSEIARQLGIGRTSVRRILTRKRS